MKMSSFRILRFLSEIIGFICMDLDQSVQSLIWNILIIRIYCSIYNMNCMEIRLYMAFVVLNSHETVHSRIFILRIFNIW